MSRMFQKYAETLGIEPPASPSPIPQPVTPSPTPAAMGDGPELRGFDDPKAIRTNIYNNVLAAAKTVEPVSNNRYSLHLNNPHWAEGEHKPLSERKRAILEGDTLQRRLRGTWQLKDPEGNIVSQRTATIAQVPHMTDQGTFVINGSDYTLGHQMRLRPGIYHREKENGELEAHVNVLPGKGLSHHYSLDRETGVFKLQMKQSNRPLLPILRAMGATDEELRQAWGNELLAANQQKDNPKVIDHVYDDLMGKKADPNATHEGKRQAIAQAFAEMQLDPEVTHSTLGAPHKNITKEAALASTKKLLDISRGQADTDDRDHMAYQQFLGPEDLIAERLGGRNKATLRELLWRATTKGSLDSLPTGAFTKHVHDAITGSGLGQCFDAETKVLTRRGFVAWPEVTVDDEFACVLNDKLAYRKASKLHVFNFVGNMVKCQTKRFSYLVTPNHRLWAKAKPYANYRAELAEDAFGKGRYFETGLPTAARLIVEPITLSDGRQVAPELWAVFLGWYIAEGWTSVRKNRVYVCVSQSLTANPEKCAEITALLNAMPVRWFYNYSNSTFCIGDRCLAEAISDCGQGCAKKRIPRYCFDWSTDLLRVLADTYLAGDGNEYHGYVKAETTSPGLADDLIELFGRLGGTGRASLRRMSARNPNWTDSYVVSYGRTQETLVPSDTDANNNHAPVAYSYVPYCGKVYCASVPGERLYVLRDGKPHWSLNSLEEVNAADVLDQQHRVTRLGYGGIPSVDSIPDEAHSVHPSQVGFIDLIKAPESEKAGIDSRVSSVTKKGSDNRIYSPFVDPKTGQTSYKSPQDLVGLTVAFPGEMRSNKKFVHAMSAGKAQLVDRSQVQLEMPHAENWFSPLSNLVPMKSASKGQRGSMGARFIAQALPLKDAEAPFVRGQVPGQPDKSFEDIYGKHMGAVHAKDIAGQVEDVTPENIRVRYADGTSQDHELFNHFPYNRKTFAHNTPSVKPGDPIEPGQLLAKSNYTDDKGATALGRNLRVAYVPFRGANYEDAWVVSESAAKDKLNSEHMYQHNLEWEDTHKRGLKNYVSIFPAKYDKKTLSNVDDEGIIRPGTVVNAGDPLVLAAQQRELSRKQVHSSHKGSFVDNSLTWDHHSPGVVTDVAKTDKGVLVAVKSYNPTQVGDKLSNRFGGKGVISQIVPDDEMPHDDQGRPFDILANPLGVVSRTNPSQYHEAALGKIAEKTGKPAFVDDFNNIEDLNQHVQNELVKHGLKGTETVIDPTTGQPIHDPVTGNQPYTGVGYYMKLHHSAEAKSQGRGLGAYTAEGMPAKGGAEGSKKMAMMDLHALLSHGAIETLRDAKLVRGQKNQEHWSTVMSGFTPPTPEIPHVYQKYVAHLQGAGINVQRKGSQLHIMNLRNQDIDEMAGDRELQNAETIDWKPGMNPIKGGLFDERLTGGHNGNRWSKITLHEPMPNPVMEEPIRRLLGLTQKKFESVLAGQELYAGKTGPLAIQAALKKIDVPQAIKQAQADLVSGRRTTRDEAIRKLGFLKGAEKNGIHPSEWMVDKVPVLPPMFRPVSIMRGSGGRLVSDANYLYKEVFDANQNLRELSGQTDDLSHERLTLYNAFKGVSGLGDPVQPKNQERKVQGLLAQVFGNSPKYGMVQQKLLGTTTDLVGRGTIVPNPDLNMDQIGLPENRAWEVYSPFVIRRMVRAGMPRVQAMEYVHNKHDVARKALLEEVNERPVIMTRAPVLHRYGEMSFFPRLTKGDTLQVSPIVVKGFNADFDGDAANYHVPASDTAAKELVEKLLPSKNLISTKSFKADMYLPSQEYTAGLHSATSPVDSSKKPIVFKTKREALHAYQNREIEPNQPITIMEH